MKSLRSSLVSTRRFAHGLFIVISVVAMIAGAEASPRRVGLTLPLSGGLAAYGSAFRQGLQLFQEEHPDYVRKVSFILDDSQYDGSKVVSSVRKLASVDKVDLIYVWGASPGEVAAPLAQQLKTPMLALTVGPVAKDRPYVAAIQLPLENLKIQLIEFLRARRIRTTGIVGTNIGAAIRLLDLVKPEMPGLAYEEIVPADLLDFRSVVTRISHKPVEAILLLLGPAQTVPFARQAMSQGLKVHLIGGDMLADEALRSELLALMGEVSYLYGRIDPAFRERYRTRFGDTSHLYEAASGYSTGLLVTQVADRLGTLSGLQFIASLASETIVTPVGDMHFSSSAAQGVHVELKSSVYTAHD